MPHPVPPSVPQLALTLPVTLEELEPKNAPQQCDSSTESYSIPGSPDSQASIASYSLWPRFHISYNEAALTCLNRRPQVKTLNFLSIPLPGSSDSDEESSSDESGSPAEVKADSPHSQDESLTSSTRHGHTPGVPSSAQDWLPADAQSRSHQCADPDVLRYPPDQFRMNYNQGSQWTTDDVHPNVEAETLTVPIKTNGGH